MRDWFKEVLLFYPVFTSLTGEILGSGVEGDCCLRIASGGLRQLRPPSGPGKKERVLRVKGVRRVQSFHPPEIRKRPESLVGEQPPRARTCDAQQAGRGLATGATGPGGGGQESRERQ